MALRFLSDAQREQLSGFPREVDAEVLDRFFTLSGADLSEVRRRHGDANRLGWALQLCGLRMLGFCPDDVRTAPAVAVRFVARQLDVAPVALVGYGVRTQTRTDHLNQVKSYLGFRSATPGDLESKWSDLKDLTTGFKVGIASSPLLVKRVGSSRGRMRQRPSHGRTERPAP